MARAVFDLKRFGQYVHLYSLFGLSDAFFLLDEEVEAVDAEEKTLEMSDCSSSSRLMSFNSPLISSNMFSRDMLPWLLLGSASDLLKSLIKKILVKGKPKEGRQ